MSAPSFGSTVTRNVFETETAESDFEAIVAVRVTALASTLGVTVPSLEITFVSDDVQVRVTSSGSVIADKFKFFVNA